MTTGVLAAEEETTNFLLPNATIFVEFALFLIVLFVLYRFVVPPLRGALNERDDMVRKQIADRDKAARLVRDAEARYEAAIAEARAEATRIRDRARADAAQVRAELREQADREVERIQREGAEQLAAQQEAAMQQLRSELGELSARLAERIVGEPISDDELRSTVTHFLAELDQVPTGGRGS